MISSESMEMYLETIYLIEKSNGHAHGVDIAKRLGVSKPSVSKAMKQLKNKGYVNQEAYGSITLTSKGRELSKKIHQDHQIITSYLEHSLRIPHDVASDNACKMEHILSDEMMAAIRSYLKNHNL